MATLAGNTIAGSYKDLLKIAEASKQSGIDGTLRAVEDGDATASALYLATDSVLVKGDGVKLYFYDADGGEHISADASGNLTIGAAVDIILAGTAVNITADTIDLSDATKDVTLNAAVNALNFDSNTLSIDASNNRIGIGTASPTEALTVSYGIGTESTLTGVLALEGTDTLDSNMVSGSGPSLDFRIPTNTGATHVAARIGCPREGGDEDANAGTLSFYTASTKNATATEKMTILKGGNVGIGTTAPSVDLVVSNGGANGIELNAGASASTIGAFNRSTSSYTNLTFETGQLIFAPQSNNRVTINMGSSNNEALAFKASTVAHGRTTYTETDTYLNIKKTSNASGGAQLIANAEDVALGYVLSLTASGGQADTTKSGSAHGLVKIWSEEHDGSNTIANITANGNILAVSGYIGGANTTVFLVDEDGDIHYDGSDAGAYDYAEMFEWEDGNPDNEDRVGYSVSLVGEKIKKAEEGETVVGIVSAVPAVCGDSPMEWQKRYKTDEWGRKIHKEVDCVKFDIQHETEPATYYQEGDDLPEGKEVGDEKTTAVYITKEKHYEGDAIPSELPDDAVIYKKLISQNSDEYNPDQEYIPRKERKEWSPVGLVGKLRMHKGQPTASSWIKMKDEGNNIEMWFVK